MITSDIIVVGSGISGLVAAITAKQQGKTVTIISNGAGVLSIGSGTIDILGYDINKKVIRGNPFDHIEALPNTHPYKIVGKDTVINAVKSMLDIARESDLHLTINEDNSNKLAVTVAGKIRPTFITPNSVHAEKVLNANTVAIVTIKHLKDCEPKLIGRRLKEYTSLKDTEFYTATLKSPFGKTKRALNSLDFARYVESSEGLAWLKAELLHVKQNTGADVLVIPPICGVLNHADIYEDVAKHIGADIVEMVSMPPGVGGFRIRQALMNKINSLGITVVENCKIDSANVENGTCISLKGLHSDITADKYTEYKADKYIIATGGIIGGGINVGMTDTHEAIFNIPIDCPTTIEDRTHKDVFGEHPFVKAGVHVNSDMQAIDKGGKPLFNNVYFAGRTLSGYDYAMEKSGYGVGIATGYNAALKATGGK